MANSGNPLLSFMGDTARQVYKDMANSGYGENMYDTGEVDKWMQYRMYQGTQEYNERQAEKNRQFMEYYYNMYDSPEAMVRQYRDAGLNPFSYGGQVGSMSSHMGTEQYLNPSDAFNIGNQSLQRQSLNQQQEIARRNNTFSMINSLIGLASNFESMQSAHQDVVAKRIQNAKDKRGLEIFNSFVSDYDFADMPNLRQSVPVKNEKGEFLTLGDLYYRSLYRDILKKQYETGSGLGSNNPQSIAAAYQVYYNMHHNLDGSEVYPAASPHSKFAKGEEFAQRSYDLMLKSLVGAESDLDYKTFSNGWRQLLQSRGISPDNNDLASTLQRMYLGASGTGAYDRLMHAISSNIDNFISMASDSLEFSDKLGKSGAKGFHNIYDKIDKLNKVWNKHRKRK